MSEPYEMPNQPMCGDDYAAIEADEYQEEQDMLEYLADKLHDQQKEGEQ